MVIVHIPELIVLLSGPVAVGKTTLRQALVSQHGFDYVRSGTYLASLATQRGLTSSRSNLQELGDSLDAKTLYRWLLDDVARPQFECRPEQERWLIDAVRKLDQVEYFKKVYRQSVLHVHLVAPEEVLRHRYESRAPSSGKDEMTSYDIAITHANEVASRALSNTADLVIDTSLVDGVTAAADLMQKIAAR